MKNKRKPLVIALICIAIVVIAAVCVWFFWLKDYLAAAGAQPVYVNSISSIVGLDTGSNPRYSGIVEPQQIYKVNKDESKTVAEVMVEPGDEVHTGDILFRYDTQDMQFSLTQLEIDQDSIANMISTLQRQLNNLQTEKKNASKDDQASYTVQINDVEIQIKAQQYESSKKKEEIDKLRESMNNAEVFSEVDGVVKEVNDTPGSQTDSSGQPSAFISILASGDYRIKGTISELNYASISVGQAVTVHSRVNAEQVWKGTVDSIDQEAATDQSNGMYYYGMDSGEKSSVYHFYVALENLEGLILGQHVYIEPDLGEGAKKEGLWLPAMYIAHDDSGSFVWARDDNDKLEKRMVTLGEYDSDNDTYQINSGAARTDFIAYPSESLIPGMPTTTDAAAGEITNWGSEDNPAGAVSPENNVSGSAFPEGDFPEGDLEGGYNSAAYDDFYDGETGSSDISEDGFSESGGISEGEGYPE